MEPPPTILVADDDADLLGLEGFRVLTAGTPSDASRAVEGGVDLLLLDLHGALDDRLERLLGELGDRRPALVVASGDPNVHDHARRLRADGVLAKPFGLEDLLCTIRAGVRARRSGQTV